MMLFTLHHELNNLCRSWRCRKYCKTNSCLGLLLAHGKKVRVFGRDARKLELLVVKGAEPFIGNVEDEESLTRFFTGVEAAYTMIPTNMTADDICAYYSRVGTCIANALSKSSVKHVVNLSSVGAFDSISRFWLKRSLTLAGLLSNQTPDS